MRRLLGIGLLWISLAALLSVPATGGITSAILHGATLADAPARARLHGELGYPRTGFRFHEVLGAS